MITNTSSGTNLHEIAPGIYRINTPVEIPGGMGFNFNQYLVADDEPLLFHTGRGACSRSPPRRSARSCRSSGCATSRSHTTRPTSVGR